MTGVAGAYFKVMTDTMIVTLVCSFFVTWLVLPVIYLLLSRTAAPRSAAHATPNTHVATTISEQIEILAFIVNS